MVYIVLGMHKSGTTLVAQILHSSGLNMGKDLSDEDLDYSNEKCESRMVREINYAILNCENVSSLEIKYNGKLIVNKNTESDILRFIQEQTKDFKNWGFKDPRTCLTYQVWKNYLPEHKLVAVYRDPNEVARHYARKKKGLRSLYTIYLALKTWKVYNKKIFKSLEENPEHIVINYNKLMEEGPNVELHKLQDFTGTKLVDKRSVNSKRDISYSIGAKIFIYLAGFLLGVQSLKRRLSHF